MSNTRYVFNKGPKGRGGEMKRVSSLMFLLVLFALVSFPGWSHPGDEPHSYEFDIFLARGAVLHCENNLHFRGYAKGHGDASSGDLPNEEFPEGVDFVWDFYLNKRCLDGVISGYTEVTPESRFRLIDEEESSRKKYCSLESFRFESGYLDGHSRYELVLPTCFISRFDTDGDGIPDVYDPEPDVAYTGMGCDPYLGHAHVYSRVLFSTGSCDAPFTITSSQTQVTSSGNIVWTAGRSIKLGDGFVVKPGGVFSASIDPRLEEAYLDALVADLLVTASRSLKSEIAVRAPESLMDGEVTVSDIPREYQKMWYLYQPIDASMDVYGRYIVFTTQVALSNDDVNGVEDVYLWELGKGLALLSRNSITGAAGNGRSYQPQMDPQGEYAVFTSEACDLVMGNGSACQSTIYAYHIPSQELRKVSMIGEGMGPAQYPSMSNHLEIVFNQMVDGKYTVWMCNLLDDRCEKLSGDKEETWMPSISSDGQFASWFVYHEGEWQLQVMDIWSGESRVEALTELQGIIPFDIVEKRFVEGGDGVELRYEEGGETTSYIVDNPLTRK